MKNLTANEKLDVVLSTLKYFYDEAMSNPTSQQLRAEKSIGQIRTGIIAIHEAGMNITEEWVMPIAEIKTIIDHLFNEGYFTKAGVASDRLYLITFNGLVFWENGGYKQKEQDLNRERERLDIENTIAKETQLSVKKWTRRAVIVAWFLFGLKY